MRASTVNVLAFEGIGGSRTSLTGSGGSRSSGSGTGTTGHDAGATTYDDSQHYEETNVRARVRRYLKRDRVRTTY